MWSAFGSSKFEFPRAVSPQKSILALHCIVVGKMPAAGKVPPGYPKICMQNSCILKMLPPEWQESRGCWGILVNIMFSYFSNSFIMFSYLCTHSFFMYACMFIYIYIYIRTHMRMFIYIYKYVCTFPHCTCMHIIIVYICIYIIYIHIHIYIYR